MKVLKWRGKELGVLVLSAGILQSGLAILRERCFLTGWKSLMFMGFFCMGVRFLAVALVRRPMIGKTRYQVRLFLNEKSKEFTAMADSGNRLVEPGGGCERVLRREGGSPYDPIPGCRNGKWNAAGSSL